MGVSSLEKNVVYLVESATTFLWILRCKMMSLPEIAAESHFWGVLIVSFIELLVNQGMWLELTIMQNSGDQNY